MSIREVLAATDFSEMGDEAVRAARHHAEPFGARLHLVHVLEEALRRKQEEERAGRMGP